MSALSCFVPSLTTTLPFRNSTHTTTFSSNVRNGNFSLYGPSRHSLRLQGNAVPFFDISPPPIDHDLLESMKSEGAKSLEDGSVETFGNDDLALNTAYEGVVVADLTHFGRIRVTGNDRIQFLHNQSTANFESYSEGEGCDTVFVNPTARTIDIVHAWIMKNSIVLILSPITCRRITEMLNKYVFMTDKVKIHDITSETCLFNLIGPRSDQVMEDLNLGDLVGQPYGMHRHYSVNGMPITVGVGTVLSLEGYSLLLSPPAADTIWKTFVNLGAIPIGTSAWERLRVLQGRPYPGKELTSDYNVLEAGLWRAVSLNKGCYKGQETISRLVTYDGVKQRLWGIRLSGPADPGTPIIVNGKKVGNLTSYAVGRNESEHVGLGYIKKRDCLAGDKVNVGEVVGEVAEVPFLRPFPSSKGT
ncbi:hypothetical protein H6P81_001732 [Aristolochia fimbriata]|uniref:GCVT N-terminal domain-containing protein n=1 Tax=Aristolochia fimbriata TaxID=158543 RepID=A0AAV7F9E0_ARIFI|nr:hypothetical protein H6P81_001732 [Aristolochia fimbriata]